MAHMMFLKVMAKHLTCENVGDSLLGHSFKLLEAQRLQAVQVQVSKLRRHHGAKLAAANHFKNLQHIVFDFWYFINLFILSSFRDKWSK